MDAPRTDAASVETKQHACEQCGAPLEFVPGASLLKCSHCGAAARIAAPRDSIEERDYHEWLRQAASEKRSEETQVVGCRQCGAQTTVPADSAASLCPFCGASMIYTLSTARLIKPDALLPFTITERAASDRFRKWVAGLWFAPGELTGFARLESRLNGVYIPFWTYDCAASTEYEGSRGIYYYTSESYTVRENGRTVVRTRRVRHTNWTPVSGTVANSFDDILVLAGKSLPATHAAKLEPWDLASLVPYADEYLSGFRAESYQTPLSEGFESARAIMEPIIRETIRSDIGGDEQQIHSARTRYESITFKHILLPVWMSAYRFRNKVYRILVNARTGEVQGERPYSAWKIAAASLVGLIAIAVLIALAASRGA